MKYPAVLLAATLPWMGLNCSGPPNTPLESPKPTQITSAASNARLGTSIPPEQAETPPDSRADDGPQSPTQLNPAANQSPPTPATPLELTLLELAAKLRLNEERDDARRAALEAEIVKLHEQRQSLYSPSVKD